MDSSRILSRCGAFGHTVSGSRIWLTVNRVYAFWVWVAALSRSYLKRLQFVATAAKTRNKEAFVKTLSIAICHASYVVTYTALC
jgi:hypothetical protein